jgi:DNA-binding MarR family transcriptional regulator
MTKRDSDVAYQILRSIRRILRKVSEHSRQLSREAGLTVPQLLCLRAIAEEPKGIDVNVALVSRKVRLSAPTVSHILDRLEAAGLARRVRNPRDRRQVCLFLTPAGRTKLERMPTPLHEEFLDRLRALEPTERRLLLGSLEKIVAMMEADELEAAPMLTPGSDLKPPPATS